MYFSLILHVLLLAVVYFLLTARPLPETWLQGRCYAAKRAPLRLG